jgi:hypothetical protein
MPQIQDEITIDPTVARNLYEKGGSIDGWTVVNAEYSLGSDRWMENYWMVLANAAGELWAVFYQRGLTENQPHEYSWEESWMQTDGRIPMVRVWSREVKVVEYVSRRPETPDA